jgi:hypothetical protein
MLTHLLAAHPTMTLERGPLLGCIELGSAGGTAALPQMQKRRATRARAGGRLVLVQTGHVMRAGGGARTLGKQTASKLARLAPGDCSDSSEAEVRPAEVAGVRDVRARRVGGGRAGGLVMLDKFECLGTPMRRVEWRKVAT